MRKQSEIIWFQSRLAIFFVLFYWINTNRKSYLCVGIYDATRHIFINNKMIKTIETDDCLSPTDLEYANHDTCLGMFTDAKV